MVFRWIDDKARKENALRLFRIGLCVLLAMLAGMLWGVWSYGFSLYMYVEDLGVVSDPELMAQVVGVPPQIKSQVIAALAGAGLCALLLLGSFVYPRLAGRSGRH